MAFTIPTTEPESLRVGDTWKWTKLLSDFDPADSWVLNYALSLQTTTSAQIQIAATDNGDGSQLVNVTAATTAGYTAGDYSWHSFVTKTTDRHTIGRGQITLLPDLDAGAVDDRSHVKKTLDALQATIEGKASRDQLSYSLGGVSFARMSPGELRDWRADYQQQYQIELATERAERGLATGNRILARF